MLYSQQKYTDPQSLRILTLFAKSNSAKFLFYFLSKVLQNTLCETFEIWRFATFAYFDPLIRENSFP